MTANRPLPSGGTPVEHTDLVDTSKAAVEHPQVRGFRGFKQASISVFRVRLIRSRLITIAAGNRQTAKQRSVTRPDSQLETEASQEQAG
jgi:hypothetical protein